MKKIVLTTVILIFSLFIGSPAGEAENTDNNGKSEFMLKIERQLYLANMIKEIEFESEVKIPGYVDIKYIEYMYDLSKKLDLSTRVVFRLVFKESSFIDTAYSDEGAEGFMQVMPKTREYYGEKLRVNTLGLDKNQENIYIGLNMLKDLYQYWNGKGNTEICSLQLTLASYNAGIGKVLKYKGVPPYEETLNYIKFILQQHSEPELYVTRVNKLKNDYTS